MIEFDENATICGYNVKELILFAQVCRKQGISEEDLHAFVTQSEWIYEVVSKTIENSLIESSQKFIDEITKDMK